VYIFLLKLEKSLEKVNCAEFNSEQLLFCKVRPKSQPFSAKTAKTAVGEENCPIFVKYWTFVKYLTLTVGQLMLDIG